MSKKRKKGRKKTKREIEDEAFISDGVRHGIVAIALFVIAGLLILAAFDLSGIAGEKVFEALTFLFGVGYFLFPIGLVLLGISLLSPGETSMTITKSIGGALFFLSGLGIIEVATADNGGFIGKFLSSPLLSFFDTWASLLLLWAFFIVALILLFGDKMDKQSFETFLRIFGKRDPDEEDNYDEEVDYESLPENEEEIEEEEPPADEEEVPATPPTDGEDEIGFFGKKTPFSFKSKSHGAYTPPPLSLLEERGGKPKTGDIKANANIIKRTLANFGIVVEMDDVSIGPSVTRYALKPAEGVKLSKILGLQNNLELALAAHPVRIEAPIPGKSLVGIEVPNTAKTTVGIASILGSKEFTTSTAALTVGLGRGISGNTAVGNISKMPHLLIAGATGSGKSVTIHAVITSLLYRNSPDALKFIMVDPKRVELTLYNGIPHLLTPVITDAKKAILALKWAAGEMESRYDTLEQSKVRDIASYHENVLGKKKGADGEELPPMPYIVIIIDELADIMSAYPRELEAGIVRLAQMSRAVGIHLILSTQRPSVNVITGLIKANIPARVALQVASQVDSRTILDSAGAEKLLGAGDMLFASGEMSKPIRLQSAYISEDEVKKIVDYLKDAYEDELSDDITFSEEARQERSDIFDSVESIDEEDELFEEARQTVIEAGKASTSYLQRKLRIGYSRAARLMDILEEHGIVGAADGSKPREVLTPRGSATDDIELDDNDPEEEEGDEDGNGEKEFDEV